MKTLLFAIAQLNPTVGDIGGNTKKLAEAYRSAVAQDADIVVAPETYLSGYQVDDLVQVEGFLEEMDKAIHHLASLTANNPAALIVGAPRRDEKGLIRNAVFVLDDGKVAAIQIKLVCPAQASLTIPAISSRASFPALSCCAVSAWDCLSAKICGTLILWNA